MYRTDFGILWEKARLGCSERIALKQVYYQGSDHQSRLDACDKCSGLVDLRDGMGREAGRGIGMGNTCKSTADSCQCMAKTITIL